ncbi:FAD-dependent oxidoreductase [Puia sp.]|uniref:FAD-binding oxidoreductase n=1 Tax=Puia sp. TaxID=2045100 RepID=UPI002F42B0A6
MTTTMITDLRTRLRGSLLQPGDKGYDNARKVYNGMIDKYPAFIARCANVADVIESVKFAQENQLLIAIRSGGHNGAGLGVCNDGLVIDLSALKGIHIDPHERTAWVEAGNTIGDIDHATHSFGLAIPSGILSTTGVGGITLGGGLGHLTRHFGLTIDNLLEAEIILANGSYVKTNARDYPDLFWAIRGGGGNFGVVVAFRFRLQPVSTVIAGPMLWELTEAANLMRWYSSYIRTAPDEVNGFFAFMTVPPGPPFPEHLHGKKMCGIVWCYSGEPAKADSFLQSIHSFSPPALDLVGPIPLPTLQSMFDPLYPPGYSWYWKGDFINELTDEAIAIHLKYGAGLPTPLSTMHLYPINGAASRIGNNDTAWNYRNATWAMVIAGVDPDPENDKLITTWARSYWEALHPHSAGGSYINFMMEEGDDRIKATYGDNYPRLVVVKKKYDPANLFCVNQNINPGA